MVSSQFWEFSLGMTCCLLSFGSWFPYMALSCLFVMLGWFGSLECLLSRRRVNLIGQSHELPSSPRLAFVEGISSTCTVSQWIHGGEDRLCSFELVLDFAVACCADTR